uniref:Uncharacterized protein n=1 Tax=Anopheles epiroticus TaxID=199890 RepID=A0A182PQE7_9DIPT
MSSARCLNWSRPPPGRHPAVLRKQLSCTDRPVSSPCQPVPGGGRSQSVTSAVPTGGDTDFCHFLVTGAIIHSNRLQTYHTYNQAHRGASASLVRSRPSPPEEDRDGGQQRQQRHRPSSASAGGLSAGACDEQERTASGRTDRRAILCKQLSLDRSILVASSIASGMATVASGGTIPLTGVGSGDRDDLGDGWAFSRKQPQQQQRQEQRSGAGTKNDADGKKGLKSGKDSRINIKIFLGQTVQQDSSDTGVSDTEGATPATVAALQQGNGRSIAPSPKQEPSSPSMATDTPTSGAGKSKPSNGNGTPNTTQAGTGASNAVANTGTGTSGSGRTSSLAQRRAQFQANRQNSEAHDRRHPPLVRAMSAPIRPADTDASKFLQGKKKPRRRKVLREKDEYNICEEDEFSDEGAAPGTGGSQPTGPNGRPVPACILPMRSRSVLGGPCDIETLVSLLSSGGSDSEKEQDSATQAASGQQSPTAASVTPSATFRAQFSSTHLAKGRAPMLKKTGKSVSFQESDLKPVATAGLNRDYRKPSFQPTVANRIRRTQQLVSTLNAFQLNKDKDRSEGKDRSERRNETADSGDSDHLTDDNSSTPTETPTIPSTNVGSAKANSNKTSTAAVSTTNNGDLQTPKEQECYRLFLKMSKKGLAVSYDTILRGMLTPTELRVLQKKKSRQQSLSGTENGADGESSPENGTTYQEFQFHPSGDPTIPEEPITPNDHNDLERKHNPVDENTGFLPLNLELVDEDVLPPPPLLLLLLLGDFTSACTNGALIAATSTELFRLPSKQLIHSDSVIFRSLFTSQ